MACVASGMSHTSGDGALDKSTRALEPGPADWAPPLKIADSGKGVSPARRAVRPELSTRPDMFRRTNRI